MGMSLADVRPEAKYAVERWIVMSDPAYKKRYFKFFVSSAGEQGVVSPPRQLPQLGKTNAARSPQRHELEEAERELEMTNWNTTYALNNSSLPIVKSRVITDKGRVLQSMMKEIIKSTSQDKVMRLAEELSVEELGELTTLFRSLSIAYEQHRTSFSSEYVVQYIPKSVPRTSVSFEDARASTLTGPVSWAPPKKALSMSPKKDETSRIWTPQMSKPAPRPRGQDGLLHWPGGGDTNSTYRTMFRKFGDGFPQVNPPRYDLSFSCGRTVPDCLVDDRFRMNPVLLPCELETRHRLKQRHPTAMPSWQLLYKDGVTFMDDPSQHNPGDLSVYMSDFTKSSSVVKPSKPTLDPFGSSLTIAMSDYNDHNTTYQSTICLSASMEYDRRLV